MRVEHVNPFVKAVQLVFETMLGTKVTVSKPEIKADDKVTNDVTGIIGMSGEVVGSAALSFPLETAKNAVQAFSGARLSETDDLFSDAIGELANMVTGNAKKDLETANVSISVPTVVIGRNHRLGHHQLGPWVLLRCQSALGPFNIEVCIVEVAALTTSGGKR